MNCFFFNLNPAKNHEASQPLQLQQVPCGNKPLIILNFWDSSDLRVSSDIDLLMTKLEEEAEDGSGNLAFSIC